MNKLLLLFTIFLFGLVFLITPDSDKLIAFFPFSDMKLTGQTYLYFLFEKLILIVLSYLIVTNENTYKGEVEIFFWLMVVDLFDYLFTYNSIWFHVGLLPFSMNILKVIIFGVVILRAWKRSIGSRYSG